MSSMLRLPYIAIVAALAAPATALAQDASEWDRNRAQLVAQQPGPMAQEITRWERLWEDRQAQLPFREYADFLATNPGFPDETTLRARAEQRLREEFTEPGTLLRFFENEEPVTNYAKAHYALALMGRDREASERWALEAWRGGEMSPTAEAALSTMYGRNFTQADQDARMDALLWQRDAEGAARQLDRVSPNKRRVFAARLAILQGGDGATDAPGAMADPGYLYNRSRELRQEGRTSQAVRNIVDGPALASLPFDQTAWITELLAVARAAGPRDSVRIAERALEAFEPGYDISGGEYRLRDDYTSLMWLGGTNALWQLGDGEAAAPLFYQYGAAARTPPTRSKGFFWAGEAYRRAGNTSEAERYYEMAAQYADKFYGQMALNRLGRDLPDLDASPEGAPTPAERQAFLTAPITRAVSEVARDAPWSTGIRFYRAIADQAETVGEHVLVADLAREIGRRDLAVNLADAAMADGHEGFTQIGYPTLDTPPGTNWTMIHALARQESQFAENAISHAGARGLMQFMPATAQEEARRARVQYSASRLIDDPQYAMQLGSNHIERLISYYDGSYPLAIAAYNAGPGNVNRWLRENGDPRQTGDWLRWIEEIGFFETKNYVQRVIENAVVYENLYPDRSGRAQPRDVEDFLR
ncbi:lytic transglycosylase domain-containing protein [Aurantiacibacter poecillastricola]|uniref:lytic transglycosylase domain-containing protein n=1 Tax=Aurantiacibacter poecillastricola TaxID=3064385 RepID=UPI00273F31A2|nr:lytic transglycosylase domain-containing protein [Aurantiacibacter sp. 219JJ12-13]MDP5261692.1 lytic transglycosylase domain-containing protein [Aurantiacibacter sp. 219JJ12-13]